MARIVWSHIEKGAVFARMEQVFRQYPNTTRKQALREAQSVLNSSRWVKITDQRVFNYKDRIDIAQQRALQASRRTPEKAVEAPAPILAPTPVPERKEDPKTRLADILELLLDVVAESVAARVAAKVADLPARQFQPGISLTEHRPKHDPQPIPHPTGVAKPGVLVIGLLPAQAYQIVSAVGDRLDLTFYTAEDAVHKPKLVRAHTVLMTKFISHAVQDKYRKATDLRFCNGSTGELVKILDSIVPPVL
jgi:hypothetical protein